MNDVQLFDGERIDDLQRDGLKIIQKKGAFCFGMDSVLLADFARVKKGSRLVDLGTGTGILPLLIHARCRLGQAEAIEINPDAAERARRTMELNALESVIHVIQGDLREIRSLLPHAQYDAVVCNPPYSRKDAALLSQNPDKRPARQETECTLQDIAAAAKYLLRYHGHLFIMLPAARSGELLSVLAEASLIPKQLRFVHSYLNAPARLILVDAVKGASDGVIIQPPLITKNPDGTDTDEVKRIYDLPADE